MSHRMAYRVSLVAALIIILAAGSGTAVAQSVDDVEVSLSDADGDGLDDSFVVDIQVTDDGAATVVRVDGPVGSLEIPNGDDGSSQAPVTNVSGNTATFGSTGYTGTYTVEGDLSGHSNGDTVKVSAWIGDVESSQADDVAETSATVSGTSETEDEDSGGTDEEDGTPNGSANTPENEGGSDEGKDTSSDNGASDRSGDGNMEENSGQGPDGSDGSDDGGTTDENGEGLSGFTSVVALFALVMTTVDVHRRG